MGLAGAHGISVYTKGAYASAPTPLDRLVYAEHHRLIAPTEMSDQKQQKNPAELKGREDSTIENMVVLGEAGVVTESHDAKR